MTPFEQLQQEVKSCILCNLRNHCTQVVTGTGLATSPLMLVGEAPGHDEDAAGFPFVGKSGQVLMGLLKQAGLSRDAIYLTNTVKCRPWEIKDSVLCENRPPSPAEQGACKIWLDQEMKLVSPSVVVCVGEKAARIILGKSTSISSSQKKWHESTVYPGIQVRVVYHPAFIMRQNGEYRKELEDSTVADFIEAIELAKRIMR